jgi:hypothetical protein
VAYFLLLNGKALGQARRAGAANPAKSEYSKKPLWVDSPIEETRRTKNELHYPHAIYAVGVVPLRI